MKSKIFITLLSCFLLSFSVASGQSVSLESVDGLLSPGVLNVSTPITFNLRITNDGTNKTGLANGFSINSPEGATWGSASGDTLVSMKGFFDLIVAINDFSTGSGADTVGFAGASLFQSGLPANYDEVAFSVTIGPLSAADEGKTIVLDSSFYTPSGVWKWAGPGFDQFPTWDGPHVFHILSAPAENTAPVLDSIRAQSVNENELLSINVSATDADADGLTLTTSTLPTGAGFVDNGDGTGLFTWTPGFDQAADYNVTFSVTDGTDTVDELVVITVVNVNQAPVIDSIGPQSVNENMNLNFVVSASDPDGGTGGVGVTGLPTGATFVTTGLIQTFDWTPTFDQAGSYDVTFTTSDGSLSDTEVVTITVVNVNRTPVLVNLNDTTIQEGVELTLIAEGSDPDSTSLTVNATPLPSGVSYTDDGNGTGTFIWTPSFDQAGSYDVIFSVSDGEATVADTITITVEDVNQAPVLAEIGPKVVTAGDTLVFTILSSDPDGTFPVLSTSALPGDAFFDDGTGNGNGIFFWATTIADSGTYEVTFSTTDGEFTDSELVLITVGEAPKMIVVDSNTYSFTFTNDNIIGDTAFVNISELNGSPITVEASESSSWMDLSGFTPSVVPTMLKIAVHPNGLAIGNYMDTVLITSAEAVNSQTIFVSMTINDRANTAPFITSFDGTAFSTDECTPIDIFIATDDAEGDDVSISMNGLVENMTFLDNGDGTGDFSFVPNFAQAGNYALDVILFDGRDTAVVPITIEVMECEPGTEGDTVSVATVPAVPGARVTVPIDFSNLCSLGGFDISVGWTSSIITLDSVSFVNSTMNLNTGFTINNDSLFVKLFDAFSEAGPQAPGSGNLVNLHFSLEVGAPAGFYPLDFYMEPMYNRDCGAGAEMVRPFFIPGGIVVDTSGNYVCGYVVDPEGNAIADATVELWDTFPSGSVQDMQNASGNGVFAFEDFTTIPFDLHAYQSGYYPGTVSNINFAQSGIMIVLTPIPNNVTPTNTWVDFFCGVNTFKNNPLPVGSVVEAYDPDGVKCGEFVVHTSGEYGFMHVYGDDEFTDADEGAMTGDAIRFFVNGIEAIATGNAVWTEDRAIIEVCLDVQDITEHVCMLVEGWNLVSWNVDSEVDDIATVLASIDACVEVVMGFEQGALTYDASLPQFSDLWSVDHLSAYWVKVNCDIDLTVLGTPVPSTTPIPVTAGWNLVSYLPTNPLATETALSTIHDDLVVALGFENDSGLTYLPGQTEFNDLTEMKSCLGYWVKVNNDGTLIYPDGGAETIASKNIYTQVSSSAGRIDATTSWMNIYAFDLKIDDTQIKSGAEIKAFNSDNKLVGSYVMRENGKFGFMPIYGDDIQTETIDGMKSGDEFYLTVNGVETVEQFIWTTSGDKLEIKSLTAKVLNGALPNSFGLNQNYPNPFNPSTTISFEIPVTSQVSVEIFNLLGQLIATPFDEVAAAGQHSVVWDGRSENGNTVSSGIYFYRLTADNFTDTKKMTLLK